MAAISSCGRPSSADENVTAESQTDTIAAVAAEAPAETPRGLILPEHTPATAAEAHAFMNNHPDSAAFAEGILHRMADDHLPYAARLLESKYDRFIIVDKWAMKVRLFDRYGRMEKEYGMACAKNFGNKHAKADSRTPEGFFSVEGVYDSTDWLFTDDDGVTSPKKGQFGPRFIRLKIPVTSQIGIHGTCSPWSIGHRCSHGCIRITNDNILELVEYVVAGMPVIVNPSKKDTQVNLSEGYDVPWISSSHDPRYSRPHFVPLTEADTVAQPDSAAVEVPDALPASPADTVAASPADTLRI